MYMYVSESVLLSHPSWIDVSPLLIPVSLQVKPSDIRFRVDHSLDIQNATYISICNAAFGNIIMGNISSNGTGI